MTMWEAEVGPGGGRDEGHSIIHLEAEKGNSAAWNKMQYDVRRPRQEKKPPTCR